MQNILVIGGSGQLGNALCSLLDASAGEYCVLSPASSELDIADSESVSRFFRNNKVDILVNCAAYTAVDNAETDIAAATRLNADALTVLADAANNYKCKVIHISTDYVCDGRANTPIDENHATTPQSVYGVTKLLGEKNLQNACPDSIIIRTSWLYSEHRNNFVKTMLRLGHTKSSIKVVCDQIGTPTYATDLASAIKSIIDSGNWVAGIYHFSNEGVASWYDFAKAIFELAGINTCEVRPCLSADYPTAAKRPAFSVLNKTKIKQVYGINIPYWRDSLRICIDNLITKKLNSSYK